MYVYIYSKIQRGQEYPANNKKEKANWIGDIMSRSCLLKHIIEEKIEGRIEVTEIR
jgi:hypothetical protein